jgi:hypothetical protein
MWLRFFGSNLILVALIYYEGSRDELNLKILFHETYMACFGWVMPLQVGPRRANSPAPPLVVAATDDEMDDHLIPNIDP